MLRVFSNLCEHFITPLRLPSSQITHAGQQEVLRTFLFHQAQLTRKKLRFAEIIDYMIALYIVSGITVRTSYGTADDKIHVLNIVLNADANQRPTYTFFRTR